jgi:hypothetical protein
MEVDFDEEFDGLTSYFQAALGGVPNTLNPQTSSFIPMSDLRGGDAEMDVKV